MEKIHFRKSFIVHNVKFVKVLFFLNQVLLLRMLEKSHSLFILDNEILNVLYNKILQIKYKKVNIKTNISFKFFKKMIFI